jgi:hypothetical protein
VAPPQTWIRLSGPVSESQHVSNQWTRCFASWERQQRCNRSTLRIPTTVTTSADKLPINNTTMLHHSCLHHTLTLPAPCILYVAKHHLLLIVCIRSLRS